MTGRRHHWRRARDDRRRRARLVLKAIDQHQLPLTTPQADASKAKGNQTDGDENGR